MKKHRQYLSAGMSVIVTVLAIAVSPAPSKAQVQYNRYYQYGNIEAFLGGLIKGDFPVGQLKQKGDFGIGAPDLLDGELTMNNGKAYQTKHTGETTEMPDSMRLPVGFVTFFHADTVIHAGTALQQAAALQWLDKYLQHNTMYAVRITGKFSSVKTRAFPPVTQPPYPRLATILNRQQFFSFTNMEGSLIGFKTPELVGRLGIPGYHFHFLSQNLHGGGHVVDFTWNDVTIEIGRIKSVEFDMPDNNEFRQFPFDKVDSSDLKKIEKGK